MADKRMFSKKIVTSDAFRELSHSAQTLYFQMSMEADDEGFIDKPISVMKAVAMEEQTLGDMKKAYQELIDKRFVLQFDTGVAVIKHWKINNYIAKDRFSESTYIEEKAMLLLDEKRSYTEVNKKCIQNGIICIQKLKNCIQENESLYTKNENLYTQYSIDKYSIVKNSIKEENIEKKNEDANALPPLPDTQPEYMEVEFNEFTRERPVMYNVDENDIVTIEDNTKKETPPLPENWKEEVEKEKAKKKAKQFTPPTIEEVRKYVAEKKYAVDPDYFYNYYKEGDWKDSKGDKVKNWKQRLYTWDKLEKEKGASPYISTNARKPSNSKSPVPTPDWYKDYRKELEEHNENNQQQEEESNNDSEIAKAAKELFG